MRQGTGIGSRPQCLAANLDVVLLIMGLDRNFNLARMERLLALAWGSGAQPVVVLTKRDLNAQWEAFVARTEGIAPGATVDVRMLSEAEALVTHSAACRCAAGSGATPSITRSVERESAADLQTGK